jgi:hypothetical protein
MRIAVLAATGPTGRQLVTQALDRGHAVTAIARNPHRLDIVAGPALRYATADARDPAAMAAALIGADAVVSALGNVKGSPPGVLTAGAIAVAAAHERGDVARIVWLGAFGTGQSAGPAGPLTRALLHLVLGKEIQDKTAADHIVLQTGGSVLHAGPLTDGPLSTSRHTFDLDALPRRIFPRPVTRATVATAMLDEAEHPRHAGRIAVPVN